MAQVATTIPDEQRPLDQIPISPVGVEHGTSEKSSREEPQEEQVTVFHNPENFTVKHPLMNKWTLWFTKPPTGKGGGSDNWADLLKEVVSFDTVEEFWGIYNNITKTSDLAIKSDYHLFKYGVRPEWEDVQNKSGGKWAYQCRGGATASIDELWLHVMLAAIGETLEKECNSEVMGVVVNVRRGYFRLEVWTRTIGAAIKPNPDQGIAGRSSTEGSETLIDVGRRFKEVLRLSDTELITFSSHDDSARRGSTRANVKLTV